MKILIIGDNTCAELLSYKLSLANHDVTVVGENPMRLTHIEEKADVTVIQSDLIKPSTFSESSAYDTDLILCVSLSDEKNLIACLLGRNVFHIPHTICCLSGELYQDHLALIPYYHNHFVLNPNHIVAQHLVDLLDFPGSHEVIRLEMNNFAVINIPIQKDFPICGITIAELENQLCAPTQILALIREDQTVPLQKRLEIQPNDHVIFAQPQERKLEVIKKITGKSNTYKNIMITGASSITTTLLQEIQDASFYITLIEKDIKKASLFADKFPTITVLHADPNDTDLFESESIEQKDVFFALSNDDEDNLVSALQANTYKIPLIATLTSQPRLIPIIEKNQIHAAIAPENMIAERIYYHVEHPQILSAQPLRKHGGQIIIIKIPQQLANKTVQDICLPLHATCFGLQREGEITNISGKTTFQANDIISLYISDQNDLKSIIECFS